MERKKLFEVGKVIYPDARVIHARVAHVAERTLERSKGKGLPCMRK